MKSDQNGGASKIIFILVILLLFMNHIIASSNPTNIKINEVMYDPSINDNYNEWVELYNPTDQPINVSEWSIKDNYGEDFLEGDFDHGNGTTIIPPHGYAIIADQGTSIYENFSIPEDTIKLYVDDSAIGNGLGNTKDKIILKNQTGSVVDAIEWGEDYSDVPGLPADLVDEGHSLCRFLDTDTDNSSYDFYDGINPTPGYKNEIISTPELEIEICPEYVSKIQNNSEFSLPFAFKVKMSKYNSNTSYQLKTYITGLTPNGSYATQTWDGEKWIYSNYYISNITTDQQGNWSEWLFLRFKRDYIEYQKNIENNKSANIYVKIRKDNITDEISKKIMLLDMDNSTNNGTIGGYFIGVAKVNDTFLDNNIILIENATGAYAGAYATENNRIDEGQISTSGYYKVSSTAGFGYKIIFLDENGNITHIIYNASVEQGIYQVDISSPESYYLVRKDETLDIPLTVENKGDFYDTIKIEVDIESGWQAILQKDKVFLNPGEKTEINLNIKPCQENNCTTTSVEIIATSENDIGEFKEITLQVDILAPDLTVRNIKIYDENKEETDTFGEGELVNLKAYVKNIGNEDAKDVYVRFYHDKISKEHLIETKYYSSIGKYQKYPSAKLDTSGLKPGIHTIIVVVDEENIIQELDELNNKMIVELIILDTLPSPAYRNALITEVYYHAHPRLNNEYITVYNPTFYDLNISGWYITNQPLENVEKQRKIIFPQNTTLAAKNCLIITQNASSYKWETGKKPDFEYDTNSDDDVPQMIASKKFTLSNKGSNIALKDTHNHTIDVVVYGESYYNLSGWNGTAINDSGEGVVLKRNFDQNDIPIDTNTSKDWGHPRRYGIGQSDFHLADISFEGEITTFVSPDNSFETIVNELRKANHSIYFNIYEFTNPFLCDELIKALRRNVSLYIFLEGSPIGGIDDREKVILNRIASHGGNIRLIVNDKENNVYARYPYDHAKYLVIDNQTVIVKSCNWAKTGIPINPTFGNREWGIIVRNNDVAEYFLNVFFDDWNPQRCDSYSFNEINLSIPTDFYLDTSVLSGSYEPNFKAETFNGSYSAKPVFSPDTSEKAICDMIESANESIYIEQLYVYKDWDNRISPFVERLVNKSKQGVDIKVILNYNPGYDASNEKCNITKQYLEDYGVEVKFVFTNWSYFTNVHNKGMIVDNKSVLVSSINWNENSVTRNREAGIIIENEQVARYYVDVFFYDWNLSFSQPKTQKMEYPADYTNTIYIVVIFTLTFAIIARDWRKRQWT